MNRLPRVRAWVASIAATLLLCAPLSAQDETVNLTGIWWQGAPVPLLPGESSVPGREWGEPEWASRAHRPH